MNEDPVQIFLGAGWDAEDRLEASLLEKELIDTSHQGSGVIELVDVLTARRASGTEVWLAGLDWALASKGNYSADGERVTTHHVELGFTRVDGRWRTAIRDVRHTPDGFAHEPPRALSDEPEYGLLAFQNLPPLLLVMSRARRVLRSEAPAE